MNKSKFLKKSLAMLLALMLVFAMIPLSASAEGAETPVVNYVYVGAGEEEATLSGEVWSAEIVDPVGEAVPVKVELDGAIPGSVAYYNALNNQNEAAENTGLGVWEFEIPAGETSVDFVVIDAGNQQRLKYTVSFTTVARDGDTSIKEVKLADAVEYDVWSNDNGDYTVVAPYGYTPGTDSVFVDPTSDTSVVYQDNTPVADGKLNISAYDVKVNFAVKAQNGEQASYTVTVIKPIPFATFAIDGERHASQIERVTEEPVQWQVAATNDDPQVEVYLPYDAKTDANNDFYFTPEFTTNYDVTVYIYKSSDSSRNQANAVELISGETYNLKEFDTSWVANAGDKIGQKRVYMSVVYSDGKKENWELTFDQKGSDTIPAIKGLSVDNYVATIEGNVINLELPASVRAEATKIDFALSTGTVVDFVNVTPTVKATGEANDAGDEVTVAKGFLEKDRYTLRVTAATNEFDKTDKAVQDYTLNITTAQVEAPKLNTVTLKSEKTGEELVGRIDGHNIYFDGKNAIPYRYKSVIGTSKSMAEDNWQFFWSASSGATITSDGQPIKASGEYVDNSDYLPQSADRFLNTDADATIDVSNGDQSVSYTIHFTSAEASQDSTLGEMKLAMNYVDSYDDLNDGNTVEVKVTTATAKSTLAANIYYSEWDAYTSESGTSSTKGNGAAAVVTKLPAEAKLFFVVPTTDRMWEMDTLSTDGDTLANTYGNYLPGVNGVKYGKGEDDATATQPLTLVVVSEAWAENVVSNTTTYTSLKNNEDAKGLYTPYELTLTRMDPRTNNNLYGLSVYDSYTDTMIEAEKDGNIFTLTLPAYFVDANRKSEDSLWLDLDPERGGETIQGNNGNGVELTWLKEKDDGSYDLDPAKATKLQWNGTTLTTTDNNPLTDIEVTSEAGKTREEQYEVKVVIADANTKAVLNSVSYNGSVGTPNGTDVTLNVPFNTEVTSMALDFNVSENAYVIEGALPTGGVDAIANNKGLIVDEGETFNFLQPRKFTVISEDGKATSTYTITVVPSETFPDVTTDQWYYDEVMTAANKGWITGDNGYFKPNDTMKRGDFALIIARIMNYDPENYTKSAFPDVDSDLYYSAAIAFCKEQNIIDGDNNGNFNAEDPITREEMAKILCQAKQLKVTIPEKAYADDAEIAQWAKGYVYACQEAGIMEGSGDNFNPRDNATRAEGAAVLVRAFA